MLRMLLLSCAAGLLVAPSRSHAEDDQKTVRLVIECSPKTADAIQHLLKGLPAKIYRADREALPPKAADPETADAKPAVGAKPTGVVSVYPVWEAVNRVFDFGGLPPITLEKMNVTPRNMRLTVTAVSDRDIVALRKALQMDVELKRRARNPDNVVELGAIHRLGDATVRGDLTVSFRELASDPGAKVEKPGFDALTPAPARAKLKLFARSAERRDRNRSQGATKIYFEQVFEETHLENLRAYVKQIHETNGVMPTELRWQLRDPKRRGGEPLIRRPAIKIAQWVAN